MIFSEVYSVYYNTVAKIISIILKGENDEKTLKGIVEKNAFGESILTILPSLKSEKWQIVKKDLTTPIENEPQMPLTELQKMWLKSISLDEKIGLFGVRFEGLEDVPPLFTKEDYRIYDRYSDGDDFTDPEYIERFRTILEAIKKSKPLKIDYINRRGQSTFIRCMPLRLEYSEKDDKFRLITAGCRFAGVINLAKITNCSLCDGNVKLDNSVAKSIIDSVHIEINDEKNCLERALLHFAHFEKKTEKIGQNKYLLTLYYDRNDVSEIVIRILSFGPRVKVVSPESFIDLIREKLRQQKNCKL